MEIIILKSSQPKIHDMYAEKLFYDNLHSNHLHNDVIIQADKFYKIYIKTQPDEDIYNYEFSINNKKFNAEFSSDNLFYIEINTDNSYGNNFSNIFYNFCGKSSFIIKKEESVIYTLSLNILNKKENIVLYEKMLDYISHTQDEEYIKYGLLFSLTHDNFDIKEDVNPFYFLDKTKNVINNLKKNIHFIIKKPIHQLNYKEDIIQNYIPVTVNEMMWLQQNTQFIRYNNKKELLNSYSLKENNYKDFNNYENIMIYNFLYLVLTKMLKFRNSIDNKSEHQFKIENGYYQINHVLQKYKNNIFNSINHSINDIISNITIMIKSITQSLGVKHINPTEKKPKVTSFILKNPYYLNCYKEIISWHDNNSIFKNIDGIHTYDVKNLSNIYEIYSLLTLINYFKDRNYTLTYKGTYRNKNDIDKNSFNIPNHYIFKHNEDQNNIIELYYEPKIKKNRDNKFFQTTQSEYLSPDYLIHYKDTLKEYIFVLDAKYSYFGKIKERLSNCADKYVSSIKLSNNPKVSVEDLIILFPNKEIEINGQKGNNHYTKKGNNYDILGSYPVEPYIFAHENHMDNLIEFNNILDLYLKLKKN